MTGESRTKCREVVKPRKAREILRQDVCSYTWHSNRVPPDERKYVAHVQQKEMTLVPVQALKGSSGLLEYVRNRMGR
jgi:hypothetical protein